MQSKQTTVIWTIVIASLILLVVGAFGYINIQNAIPTATEVAGAVVIPAITVPTASEIANEIKLPTLRNDNFDDILEGIYPNEVNDLENDCQNDLSNEFMSDIKDDLEDTLEAGLGIDVKDVSVQDWDWDNDYDFTVINLGLSDEEDRAGEIYTILRVRYHEEFGDNKWHYAKVYTTSSCSDWDENDNEFDNLEVEYILD